MRGPLEEMAGSSDSRVLCEHSSPPPVKLQLSCLLLQTIRRRAVDKGNCKSEAEGRLFVVEVCAGCFERERGE